MFDENALINQARSRNSFTSPELEDNAVCDDGTYFWDCCNIHYCKDHLKPVFKKHSCLRGSCGDRCTVEQKLEIRAKAKESGFTFED